MAAEPRAKPSRGFDLGDYVEVKDRITLFYAAHPEGRLETKGVRVTTEPDGKPRVWVEAAAYRTPDDPHPGRGWSWMELPGTTSYTRGSELENTETSAWGRAIAALGLGIKKSIATKNEIDAKAGGDMSAMAAEDGLLGIAEAGKPPSDWELRQAPEPRGWALSFRLVEGRTGIKVVAFGVLALAIRDHRAEIEGKRVTAWGSVSEESFDKGAKTIWFKTLTLTRLQIGDLSLPSRDGPSTPEAEPVADVSAPAAATRGMTPIAEAVAARVVEPVATAPDPTAVETCGDEDASPMMGGFCAFPKGHTGVHGNGRDATWPR